MGPRILNTHLRSKHWIWIAYIGGPSQKSIQNKSNNNSFHIKWIGSFPEISLFLIGLTVAIPYKGNSTRYDLVQKKKKVHS